MAHSITVKHLFVVASSLTMLSLFVAHNINPLNSASFLLRSPSLSLSTDSAHNVHVLHDHALGQIHTSPECQATDPNVYPDLHRNLSDQPPNKYAYIHVLDLHQDITFQLYGILAFQGGLQRTHSMHDHLILIPLSNRESLLAINSKQKVTEITQLLQQMASSPDNNMKIITFDAAEIDQAFEANAQHSQFRDTFHAAFAFKSQETLNEYDKLLMVKYNTVILSNNMDILFNYPTPSAPPQRWSGLQSNMACFLYSLRDYEQMYEVILQHLQSDLYVWYNDDENKNEQINNNPIKWSDDAWNSERGTFEGLINAIYWNRAYGLNGINQLHQKFAVSTNKLSNRRTKYFVQHRPNMFYMIEFVDDYPPTQKARDRCNVRSAKMMNDGYKLDWFDVAMNTYFVQFWLDLHRICGDAFDGICGKLQLEFGRELKASKLYEEKYGYPFPFIA